jgi:hypothetical protein
MSSHAAQDILSLIIIATGLWAVVAVCRAAGRIVWVASRTGWLFLGGNYYHRRDRPVIFWVAVVGWVMVLTAMALLFVVLVAALYVASISSFQRAYRFGSTAPFG